MSEFVRQLITPIVLSQELAQIKNDPEAWKVLGFPIPYFMSEEEHFILRAGQVPLFFKKILGTLNSPPLYLSRLRENPKLFLTVLHFLEGKNGLIKRIVCVQSPNILMGEVNVGGVEIPIFLSWSMHGEPCEKRSIQNGGRPYPSITRDQMWNIIDEIGNDLVPEPSAYYRREFLKEVGLIE